MRERETQERWRFQDDYALRRRLTIFSLDLSGDYLDPVVQVAWESWATRASLDNPPASHAPSVRDNALVKAAGLLADKVLSHDPGDRCRLCEKYALALRAALDGARNGSVES